MNVIWNCANCLKPLRIWQWFRTRHRGLPLGVAKILSERVQKKFLWRNSSHFAFSFLLSMGWLEPPSQTAAWNSFAVVHNDASKTANTSPHCLSLFLAEHSFHTPTDYFVKPGRSIFSRPCKCQSDWKAHFCKNSARYRLTGIDNEASLPSICICRFHFQYSAQANNTFRRACFPFLPTACCGIQRMLHEAARLWNAHYSIWIAERFKSFTKLSSY